MAVGVNDLSQAVSHQGQHKVVLPQGVGGLFLGHQALQAVGEDVEVQLSLCASGAFQEIVVGPENVQNLRRDLLPFLLPQLALPPFGEALKLFRGEIAFRLDQLPDALFHLGPVQQLVRVRVDDVPQPDADALGVIIDGEFLFRADRIDASGAVLLFQELRVVGGGLLL